MPLVSVVIPVYNQERYIKEAVESVLGQTYPQVELVVVDDGSTDRTPEILKTYGSRLRYIRQSNAGAATALNNGIAAATGELVGWLSSDDVYEPAKVQRQVELFQARPEISLTYTDFNVIDGDGRLIRTVRSPYYSDRKEFIRRLILGNFVNGSSVIAKKKALVDTGLFDPVMTYHADANMWLRLLKRHEFGHVNEVLLNYRWHAGNASNNVAAMRRHRYVYFDKIWETLEPKDVVNGGGATQDFERFRGQALVANGLFDRAVTHYRRHGGSPRDYAVLAATWARWTVKDAILRRRQAAGTLG
jgi:glycosyltransferase involved in cell wall biosynthesis